MPNLNKVFVSTGQRKRNNRLNLGGFQVNSTDFGFNKVLSCTLMQPGDKYNVHLSHELQMTPLVGHTLGKCTANFKSFFVPCRLAYRYFEELQLHRNVETDKGTITPKLPMVTNNWLTHMFMDLTRCGWRSYDNPSKLKNGLTGETTSFDNFYSSSPWSEQNDFVYINPLMSNLGVNLFDSERALVEPVAICAGVDNDGKPVDVCHFAVKFGKVYLCEPDRNTGSYDGSDYDFVGMFQSFNDDTAIYYRVFGFQSGQAYYYESYDEIKEYSNTANTTAKPLSNEDRAYPYVLFKFTKFGKRVYDFLQTLGYGLNFGVPFLNYWEDDCYIPVDVETGEMGNIASVILGLHGQDWRIPFVGIPSAMYSVEPTIADTRSCDFLIDIDWGEKENYTCYDLTQVDLLKVYSFFKIYLDYLCPNYWYETFYKLMSKYFYGSSPVSNAVSFVNVLWYVLQTNYDKDYFTQSWLHPNQPTDEVPKLNVGSDLASIDTSAPNSQLWNVDSDETGTLLSNNDDPTSVLSKPALDLVSALHKLARVTGLAGNRYIDQLFARFGVKNSNSRLQRAEFIEAFRSRFDIDTVLSNASTSDASLGDYTAHGHSENSGKLGSGEVTEFGFLFVMVSIMPIASYYQGRLRENLYDSAMDFYQPELDAVDAMQSVRMDELIADNRVGPALYLARSVYKPDGTFGYSRLWSELKKGRDYLGGDFRLQSRGKYTNNAYHLFREIPSLASFARRSTPVTNRLNFSVGSDCNQYARIFQLLDSDFDHFYLFMNLDIFVSRNVKALNDFSFDDECEKVERSINNGGTEL